MGQRANLIIFSNNSYELYYSHWCANSLTKDLFWGPTHALNYVRMQKRVHNKIGWLDEVWAEGGAVIDLDKKIFLLYGGEDLLTDIPLRRVYMRLLSQPWNGWEVKWTYEGIADLAGYVGYPKSKVLKQAEAESITFTPPKEKEWLNLIMSVKFVDGRTKVFPLDGMIEDFLCYGPKMIAIIDKSHGYEEIIVPEWTSTFPLGGFHVDVAERTLDYWLADVAPGLLMKIKEKWCGWKVNWHMDCFESHIEKTKGRIILHDRSLSDMVDNLRDIFASGKRI